MQSRWSDTEAQDFVTRYAPKGVNADLAVRTYTTRLLGGDPRLVLHGGGNTSVKTVMKDMLGEDVDVICIKGSGWDMGSIEPAGLPAVRLEPLRKLRALPKLSDEDMVNFQRINLLDSASPNPSVETLLHAFLPHKFIDHTHSTAVLALTDQPDGEAVVREVYGDRVAYVPYTIPGFALAKSVADVFDKNPKVEGLVLLQHGIFTVGATAEEAYSRMIAFVTMAEDRLGRQRKPLAKGALPAKLASVPEIAPILRGAVAIEKNAMAGSAKRQILDFRTNPKILEYVNGAELARYSQQGVVTPDHTIRTKNWPMIVPAPEAGKLGEWAGEVRAAVDAFVARYHDYFARNNAKSPVKKKELDPLPRVILVPGVGMFGIGGTAKDAAIAADIAENAIAVIARCRSDRRIQMHQRIRHVRSRILVAGTGQAGQVERKGAGASGGGDHRRRLRNRGGDGESDGRAGRGSGDPGPRPGSGQGGRQENRRQGAGGGLRRYRSGQREIGVRPGGVGFRRRRYRGLQCGRGLAGHHRHGR